MQCNIDARGKRIRLLMGLANLAAGLALAGMIVGGVLDSGWWWLVVAGFLLGGSFAVFEARAGWCAARAMGIRTPF